MKQFWFGLDSIRKSFAPEVVIFVIYLFLVLLVTVYLICFDWNLIVAVADTSSVSVEDNYFVRLLYLPLVYLGIIFNLNAVYQVYFLCVNYFRKAGDFLYNVFFSFQLAFYTIYFVIELIFPFIKFERVYYRYNELGENIGGFYIYNLRDFVHRNFNSLFRDSYGTVYFQIEYFYSQIFFAIGAVSFIFMIRSWFERRQNKMTLMRI